MSMFVAVVDLCPADYLHARLCVYVSVCLSPVSCHYSTSRRICHLTAATDVHQLSSSPDGLSLMAATDDDIELWTFSLPWKKALADLNLKSDTST